MKKIYQGAEAVLYLDKDVLIKERIKKNYRLEQIDTDLRKGRTRHEVKILNKLLKHGLNVPEVYENDDYIIKMQYLKGPCLKDVLSKENNLINAQLVAKFLTKMHELNVIHGDLTTSNMLVVDDKIYFIDFGLSFISDKIEDKAVELHLLKRALDSRHSVFSQEMFDEIVKNYLVDNKKEILKRFEKVEGRGRNKNK